MAKKNIKDKINIGPNIGGIHPFIRRKELENGKIQVSAGVLNDSIEGASSLATLERISGSEYEVKEEIKFTSSGPAQVSNDAYRKGWDGIFGKKTVGEA